MILVIFSLIMVLVNAVEVAVEGDISFDVKISNERVKKRFVERSEMEMVEMKAKIETSRERVKRKQRGKKAEMETSKDRVKRERRERKAKMETSKERIRRERRERKAKMETSKERIRRKRRERKAKIETSRERIKREQRQRKAKMVTSKDRKKRERIERKAKRLTSREIMRKERMERRDKRLKMVTVAEAVDCVYQYPEKPQVEALLSNMMNQLAKVYTRVQDFVNGDNRRRAESRFRVVMSSNESFFEEIYNNMTTEYRNLYNTTADRVPRTSDPCNSQPELKGVWERLLESSISYLRKAVTSTIGNYLRMRTLSSTKKSALEELVDRELARVRSSQLDTLCDDFQLCYNELL